MIGVPARDGRITAATAMCLLSEYSPDLEIGVCFSQIGGVHFARDEIVMNFLASDAERLMFIDEDVTWAPGDLARINSHDVDFVGGCYRLKQPEESYPIKWLGGVPPKDVGTDLVEVEGLPGGFLSISRKVFERLYEAAPDRNYTNAGQKCHAFFCMPYGSGEDYRFCFDWRQLGGKVWLDPAVNLTHHAGTQAYTGNIGNWLRSRNTEAA